MSEYKLKKTGTKRTSAHPDGKPTFDIHHNNEVIGTVEPYSAYHDRKRAGSRIVSSRKDVTRYMFSFHKDKGPQGHEMGGTGVYMNRLNSRDALDAVIRHHTRWKASQVKEQTEVNEVLDMEQRRKRAMVMRRNRPKIERAKEIAKKKMAPDDKLRKRAFIHARQLVRKRVAGERGSNYADLSASEKMMIDRQVEGKKKLIKAIATQLLPKVKRAESQRLSSFTHGKALVNKGAKEGHKHVSEDVNEMFSEVFATGVGVMGGAGRSPDAAVVSTNGKKLIKKGDSKNSNIIQYNKFQEDLQHDTPAFSSLWKKSEKSGIDLAIIGEVYNRGWNSWDEEMGVDQQQYAFARVNSFIKQGKSYFEEDADLQELSKNSFKVVNATVSNTDKKYHVVNSSKQVVKSFDTEAEAIKHSNKFNSMNENQNLQELSHKTLDRYVTRASGEFSMAKVGERGSIRPTEKAHFAGQAKKRKAGIARAIDKQDAATGRQPEKPVRVPARMTESNNTPYVRPHMDSTGKQAGWKASNKHGKVKYFGNDFKDSAKRHAGLQEARPVNNPAYDHSEKMWDDRKKDWEKRQEKAKADKAKPVSEEIKGWKNAQRDLARHRSKSAQERMEYTLHRLKKDGQESKLYDARTKHSSEESAILRHQSSVKNNPNQHIAHNLYKGNELVAKLVGGKRTVVEQSDPCWKGYKQIGTKNKGGKQVPNCVPTSESAEHPNTAMRKSVQKVIRNRADRKDIEHIDRADQEYNLPRQTEIFRKIIEQKKIGNKVINPAQREVGTDSLVNTYKGDTPGEGKAIDEIFASSFAEQVKTADVTGEVVPAHTRTVTHPDGSITQVTVPGHVRRGKKNKTIIGSGNVTDGKPG